MNVDVASRTTNKKPAAINFQLRSMLNLSMMENKYRLVNVIALSANAVSVTSFESNEYWHET